MKYLLTILPVLTTLITFGQGDIDIIKNQRYMEYANRINCDSTSGSNIEHRICLNLEFQQSDSILTIWYENVMNDFISDSLKQEFVNLQQNWRDLRSSHCRIYADGLQGHTAGIYYLSCMIELTNNRTEELKSLQNRHK